MKGASANFIGKYWIFQPGGSAERDECDYTGGSATGYYTPSFFVEEFTLSRTEQKRIATFIKNRYISSERLTQAKMEEFFRNDTNFVDATPGFFESEMAAAG